MGAPQGLAKLPKSLHTNGELGREEIEVAEVIRDDQRAHARGRSRRQRVE